MKEEVKRWFEKAKKDLDTANYLFKGNKHEDACLYSQQSVEKALKAVLLDKTNKIIKTHNLPFLAEKVNLPQELKDGCKELDIVYLIARYPDAAEMTKKSEKAKKFISFAQSILKWTEEQLSKTD